MKAHYKEFAVTACTLLLLGFGLLYSTRKTLNVSAAAAGGITGTIKLDCTPPHQKPTWDQKGCQYIPHVMSLDVNQHFEVSNSDPHSHNIHPLPKPNGANHEWNRSQPPGTPPFDQVWAGEEIAIPVKCNIHPWMHGYMAVVKGPTAVSDDNGSYTISNLPPGNYTVTAWQETYGAQSQKVTVAAGKPATADFTYKAK